jgi:hypothetical protein
MTAIQDRYGIRAALMGSASRAVLEMVGKLSPEVRMLALGLKP